MYLIFCGESVNIVVPARVIRVSLRDIFVYDNKITANPSVVSRKRSRLALAGQSVGLAVLFFTLNCKEIAMRSNVHSLNTLQIIQLISQFSPEHRQACFVVLTALISRREPAWDGVPAELREDYQKLWEKYAQHEGTQYE